MRADDLFCDLGVCVVTSSQLLGGFVGEQLLGLRCGVTSVFRAFLKLLKMSHRHHLQP